MTLGYNLFFPYPKGVKNQKITSVKVKLPTQYKSKIKLPTQLKTKLRICPTGCTQKRTKSYRLAEKKTFDGRKCSNCGFLTLQGKFKPIFRKFTRADCLEKK